MRYFYLFIAICFSCIYALSKEPDILVTEDGEKVKVYNLDLSPAGFVYYTLTEDDNAPIQKMPKSQILVVKKADGSKIVPDMMTETERKQPNLHEDTAIVEGKNDNYKPVTHKAVEDDFVYLVVKQIKIGRTKVKEHDGNFIEAADENGRTLNFRLVPGEDKTLAVTRSRVKTTTDKKGKIKEHKTHYSGEYHIPDYVQVGSELYTVKYIDPHAFEGNPEVTEVKFPRTLKEIGERAFAGIFGSMISKYNKLQSIILPDGLERIGVRAFWSASDKDVRELYIPASVKEIGSLAFMYLGRNTSYYGYFQGNITSLPDFVTPANCKDFGIDEEALEVYEKWHKK